MLIKRDRNSVCRRVATFERERSRMRGGERSERGRLLDGILLRIGLPSYRRTAFRYLSPLRSNGSNLSCFNGEGMEGTATGKGNRYLLWLRGARRYNDAHPAGKWNSCGFAREERRFVKIRGVSLSLRPAIPLSSFFLYAPATRIIVSSLYS